MAYDLVIRNGTVMDGSGLPGYLADVAVRDGRVAAIGRISERGRTDVDAEGHVVTPGFIDGHTHMDAQVMWDPLGTSACWHGITTVVMGNCGFTLAPVRSDALELVVRNLERAEDIAPEALAAGIDWTWETFPEYLDAVERVPKGINYSAYLGHSALRTWAMGTKAFEAAVSEEDLSTMERVLREAMLAGAMGFTTSRNSAHQTTDDKPVASRVATWDEVRRLVGVMGDLGGGLVEMTPETVTTDADSDPAARADFWDRVCQLAAETGIPFTFGVLGRDRTRWFEVLDVIDRAATMGARLIGQTTSRESMTIISFRTQMPFDALPEWAEVRSRPFDEQRRLLADPELRRRLVDAAEQGAYREAVGPELRKLEYDWTYVLDHPLPPYRRLSDMSAETGRHPVDLMIDRALETDFHQIFVQIRGRRDEEGLGMVMHHPRTVMTFTDTGAHVTQIIDSSLQTYLLGYWVRQRQEFTLEEAVRMLTLVPARIWGFAGRGLLEEGAVADLNVFDPDRVAPAMPEVARDLPGGAIRLTQRAEGFLATIVAGEVVHRDGQHTGALPGALLPGPLARR